LSYISHKLATKTEKDNAAALLKQMDGNGDGCLCTEEIRNAYREMGSSLSDKQIAQIFEAVDIDQSGYISYSEFIIASIDHTKLMDEKRLEAAFKMFDANGDGIVTSSEIKTVIRRSSCALLDADFDKVCDNIDKQYKDGIKADQFKNIIDEIMDFV